MVKKHIVALLVVFMAVCPVFAGFDFFFGTDFSIKGNKVFDVDDFDDSAEAVAYAEITYAENNLKINAKGEVSLNSGADPEYELEKISARYRIKNVGGTTLIIMAGKYPSAWGLGYVDGYKAGDIITPEDNEYSVSVSQHYTGGWQAEIQAVLPILEDETFKIGAQGRKDFYTDVLKEARLSTVLNPSDEVLIASAAADLSIWADITAGADFSYYYGEDAVCSTNLTAMASALKSFDLSTDFKDMTLLDSLCAKVIVVDGEYSSTSILNNATLDFSDRTVLYANTKLDVGTSIDQFTQIAGVTYTIANGLKADGNVTYIHTSLLDSLLFTATLSFSH